MKHISVGHLIASNTLYVQPERNIVDTMAPLEILRLTVEPFAAPGMSAVGYFTGKGSLKMMTSDGRWFNSKGRTYCIAQKAGAELVVESWSLTSEDSFNKLQAALREDRMLLQHEKSSPEAGQVGWRVILTKKDAELIKLCYDTASQWQDLSQAYLNHVMRAMVRWESHPSPARVILGLMSDEPRNLDGTEMEDSVELFNETMDDVLRDIRKEVEDFVEKDPWAFYYVGKDVRGVYISRHRDVRAIIWDRERTEELDIKERDA